MGTPEDFLMNKQHQPGLTPEVPLLPVSKYSYYLEFISMSRHVKHVLGTVTAISLIQFYNNPVEIGITIHCAHMREIEAHRVNWLGQVTEQAMRFLTQHWQVCSKPMERSQGTIVI